MTWTWYSANYTLAESPVGLLGRLYPAAPSDCQHVITSETFNTSLLRQILAFNRFFADSLTCSTDVSAAKVSKKQVNTLCCVGVPRLINLWAQWNWISAQTHSCKCGFMFSYLQRSSSSEAASSKQQQQLRYDPGQDGVWCLNTSWLTHTHTSLRPISLSEWLSVKHFCTTWTEIPHWGSDCLACSLSYSKVKDDAYFWLADRYPVIWITPQAVINSRYPWQQYWCFILHVIMHTVLLSLLYLHGHQESPPLCQHLLPLYDQHELGASSASVETL